MKFMKKSIAFLTMLLMLSTTTFAEETKDVSFKATFEGDSVSVVETKLMGDVDNSELQVQVVKQIGEQSTVVYTGNLGGYDNGAWSTVDFRNIQFLLLLDCDTMEDEAIYIIPTSSEYSATTMSLPSANENVSSFSLENLDNSLNTDIRIIYNNEYYEAVLMSNNTLNVSITISNSGVARELVCYLAEYDSTGRLLELTANNTISVPAGETFAANLTKTFSDSNTASAKIFLWEENNLKPITSSILLQTQQADYYADTYTAAHNYDISKTINGKINSASDIDYIKFIPAVSGRYIIQTTGIATTGVLYSSSHEPISNGITENSNFYIKADFVANETYYIRISGTNGSLGDYSLTAEPYNELQVYIYNNALSIEGDVSSTIGNLQPVTVKFLNTSGTVLNTQSVNTSDAGELNISIPVTIENGQYKAVVSANGKIATVIDLNVLKDTVTYSVETGEFCSVPYVVTNATTLENVYYSLNFNSNDFDIYDVCDYTQLVENGTGLISGGYANILEKTDSACVFKSTRTTANWSGTVNSIKLKSKRSGAKETTRYVYQVK